VHRIFIKKYFLFRVGNCCCIKQFTTGSGSSLKDVQKLQMILTQMWKWLRQQSKDFYSAGFDTLVKRWNKYISAGGVHIEK
jgi:hypothetical protein